MRRFDKSTCLLVLLKSIYLKGWVAVYGIYVLLFPEFINMVSVLCYTFLKVNILLYNFLVFPFARYKEYVLYGYHLISFNKFTCASTSGNLWNIYFKVRSLIRGAKSEPRSSFSWLALHLVSDSIGN